jgi:hypothetical protein
MINTLLSSFIGVAALRIGFPKNPGRLGGDGSFSIAAAAY